jgi:hypothetical protein
MSRNQRIGLIVAALVVGIVAFAVASPGGDEDDEQAAQTTPTQTQTETTPEEAEEAETEAEPAPPPEPAVTRISIKGGQVVGGAKRIEAGSGETVRIVVSSDAPDELHLHGYDITMNAAPGQPARFQFKANLEGVFELESHVAEDAGRDPLVAQVVVQPT